MTGHPGQFPSAVPVACEECDWRGDDVIAVRDLVERVLPGGDTMPEGECPQCGALIYSDP